MCRGDRREPIFEDDHQDPEIGITQLGDREALDGDTR